MLRTSLSLSVPSRDGECVLIIENLTRQQKRIISHCPSSLRCWNDWRNTPISVSSMGILVITKFPSIRMIKAKLHSDAHMERMHTEECRSGCAMHPPHSKDAWCPFSRKWLRRSWKVSVTPQCYGCINHVHSISIIISSKHIMIIIYLEPCHSMQKYDLNCLNRLPMLMFEWTMLVFVLNALVISLSMLNLTLGTMFMLVTSPKYAFKSYLWK